MPGFKVVGFFGVLAPASTPRDILARLNGEIVKVVAKPEIRKSFEVQALEPANTSPDQFAAFIKGEVGRRGKLIREAAISVR